MGKTEELLRIVNISEEELEKLNFKEKQKYYAAKSKLGKIIHKSNDANGKGITFSYQEQIKGIQNYKKLRNRVLRSGSNGRI